MKIRLLAVSALLLNSVPSCQAQMPEIDPAMLEPRNDTVFTSTREIRDLKVEGSNLWVATAGGVLLSGPKGPRKWTRKAGLPSNEAFEVDVQNGNVVVRFPLSTSSFDGKKWTSTSAPPFQKKAISTKWNGQSVVATLDGLKIGNRQISNPPGSGTHISALLADKKELIAAFYGDGLWRFDGKTWKPDLLNSKLNSMAREITALTTWGVSYLIGTRRVGILSSVGGYWHPVASFHGAEIYNANIQNLGSYRGRLWGSTLDDGLIMNGYDSWAHVTTPTISSTAPRQMLEWQNQLYVRHGNGVVDSFDGSTWTKNALKSIPRQGVYALASTEDTLFAAGWGGWSEWNGGKWAAHFDIAELKGIPLMGLLVDGDTLWIATQSRGLGHYSRADGTFRWFDERDGLTDDWITALTKYKGAVYAGTFVGGLVRQDGEKWVNFPELGGENVTSLAVQGDRLFAATRHGVWEVEGTAATKVDEPWLDSEVQALWPGKSGLWVGARTSLNFWKTSQASASG